MVISEIRSLFCLLCGDNDLFLTKVSYKELKVKSMHFKFREHVKSMALGGLLVFAVFMFGNMNKDIKAQSEPEVIDKLVVRELVVLKNIQVKDNEERIQVLISHGEHGGRVVVIDKNNYPAIGLFISENSDPVVFLSGKEGGMAGLHIHEGHGGMKVIDKYDKAAVIIDTSDGEGSVITLDRLKRTSTLD